MKKFSNFLAIALFFAFTARAGNGELTKHFVKGKVAVQSISVMTFGPEGILFIGDSKSGSIVAIDTEAKPAAENVEPANVQDLESRIASLLGTTPKDIVIHDLAVNPVSKEIYLAVSRADVSKINSWTLPNDIAYAQILLKIDHKGELSEVSLENASHSVSEIPSPKEEGDVSRRNIDKRTQTITDLAYNDGKIYIAGLSNEEFSSSMRIMSFPFKKDAELSTVEIWHAAHGRFETQSPIRTFLPITLNETPQLLAAYTCTPLVSIPVSELKNGNHIKTKTLAELGAGNTPLDILKVNANGKEKIIIANTRRTVMSIDPADILKQTEGLTEKVNSYQTDGVPYTAIPMVGVMQIDNFGDDYVVGIQRMPNGSLDLVSFPTNRL